MEIQGYNFKDFLSFGMSRDYAKLTQGKDLEKDVVAQSDSILFLLDKSCTDDPISWADLDFKTVLEIGSELMRRYFGSAEDQKKD
jgi:hypothetical protein